MTSHVEIFKTFKNIYIALFKIPAVSMLILDGKLSVFVIKYEIKLFLFC